MIILKKIAKLEVSKSIVYSIFYKGINMLFSFLLVRFSIGYIGSESYGVWLTMLSFFTWFTAVEAGVGGTLRKKMTIFYSEKKVETLARLLASGYLKLAWIFIIILTILTLTAYFTSFPTIFLGKLQLDEYLFTHLFVICAFFYFTYLIFFFLNTILLSFHLPESTYKITAWQNGLAIIGILFLEQINISEPFFYYCIWLSASPLLVWIFANLYYFKGVFNSYKPKFSLSSIKQYSLIKNIQPGFFIMQLCLLVIYSTDHLIISNYLSGTEVTKYNIGFKYFNLLTIVFNLIILPYWSLFSEAAHKKNKHWIKQHVKKLIYTWLIIFILAILMLFIADKFYNLWIGEDIEIGILLSIFMAISALLTAWNNIFYFYLNAVEDLSIQRMLLIISAIINVPLSIYLLSIWGAAGVIIATSISLLPLSIMLPFRYRFALSNI